MGLDQYAFATKEPIFDVDFIIGFNSQSKIFYARKNPNLQGWMEKLYYKKGGKYTFNQRPIKLTKEDLLALLHDVANENLEETTGFFFGEPTKEKHWDILELCKMGLIHIEEGYNVYYISSW